MAAAPVPGLAEALAGQYELVRELGRGGMGVVYLARELRLERQVALKVLPPDLARTPELRERFVREARTAAQLAHPNIVPIYRADDLGGFAFFAMGFVEGETLAERIRARGRLSPAETVRVLREVAWALAYAHARGVVHRDVKPENVLVEQATGRVLVTDFGIARDGRASPLTQEGNVLGSVHYMSPEQATGEPLDGRSDLYALGVIGFLALTGTLPFTAEAPGAVLVAHATKPAPRVRERAPDVPEPLARVIDRCLAKAPADRYATGEALADALGAALGGEATPPGGLAPETVLTPEQAEALWLRAAQLQLDAATRIRLRAAQGETLPAAPVAAAPTSGYRLRDVEAAAREVGIAPEYVALALSELPAAPAPAGGAVQPFTALEERAATFSLGSAERSLSVSRVIRAQPARVLEVLGKVVTGAPYELRLLDVQGGHPLDGGLLVFEVPGLRSGQYVNAAALASFRIQMEAIELRRATITLHALPGDGGTEVRFFGDLRPGVRANWKASKWWNGLATLGGLGVGWAIAVKSALAWAPFAPLLVPIVLGGGAFVSYRAIYRKALRDARAEVEGMLQNVESAVRSQAVFGTVPPPPGIPPARDDGSDFVVISS